MKSKNALAVPGPRDRHLQVPSPIIERHPPVGAAFFPGLPVLIGCRLHRARAPDLIQIEPAGVLDPPEIPDSRFRRQLAHEKGPHERRLVREKRPGAVGKPPPQLLFPRLRYGEHVLVRLARLLHPPADDIAAFLELLQLAVYLARLCHPEVIQMLFEEPHDLIPGLFPVVQQPQDPVLQHSFSPLLLLYSTC